MQHVSYLKREIVFLPQGTIYLVHQALGFSSDITLSNVCDNPLWTKRESLWGSWNDKP